jgi:hypothetical protein
VTDLLELAVKVAQTIAGDEAFEEVGRGYTRCSAGRKEFAYRCIGVDEHI